MPKDFLSFRGTFQSLRAPKKTDTLTVVQGLSSSSLSSVRRHLPLLRIVLFYPPLLLSQLRSPSTQYSTFDRFTPPVRIRNTPAPPKLERVLTSWIAELFQQRKKYDVPVWESRHPSLNEYLGRVVEAIGEELGKVGALLSFAIRTADGRSSVRRGPCGGSLWL